MNCKENLKEIDRELCENTFEHFRKNHDLEIQVLKTKEKTLISMGV